MTLTLDRPRHRPCPARVGAGTRVPLVTGGTAEYANLDLAASAPALEPVAAHVADVLPLLSSVHRGAGYLSQVSTALLERARECVGEFVGARRGRRRRVHPQHHGRAEPAGHGRPRAGAVPGRRAPREPAALALPDAPHAAGGRDRRADPGRPRGRAAGAPRRRCSPSPARPTSPARCCRWTGSPRSRTPRAPGWPSTPRSSPRTAGSTSPRPASTTSRCPGTSSTRPSARGRWSGAATGSTPRRPTSPAGAPSTRVDLDEATWAPAPHRHEAGTPNVLGVAALAQACRTLAPVLDGAGAGPRARPARPARGRSGDGAGRDPAADLARQHGPGGGAELHGRGPPRRLASPRTCRPSTASGCATAGSAPTRCSSGCAGTRTAPTATAVRASIGLGTTAEHVDRLVAALHALVTRGPRWTYAPVDGRWAPTPDPRDARPAGRRHPRDDRHRMRPGRPEPGSRAGAEALTARSCRRPTDVPVGHGRRVPVRRHRVAQQHAAAPGVVVDQHRLGHGAHQRDAPPPSARPSTAGGSTGGTQLPWSTTSTHSVPGSVHRVSSTTPERPGP